MKKITQKEILDLVGGKPLGPYVPQSAQPIVRMPDGVVRFQRNGIVEWMLEMGGRGERFDMNSIAMQNFTAEDRAQLAQLIGYSVGGYGNLSYVSDEIYERSTKHQNDCICPNHFATYCPSDHGEPE